MQAPDPTPLYPTPLLVVIGPSGSGKSTLVRLLHDHHVVRVHPTWTTRPRRPDEREGSLEHRFVDDATFDVLAETGCFLDTVAMFGLPYRYGLPPIAHSTDGRIDAVMLRASLVDRLTRVLPDRPLFVIQVEASPGRIHDRLSRRGGSPDERARRLEDNDCEARAGRAIADRVFCNDGSLAELVHSVKSSIRTMVVTTDARIA
jgi:guanylate kinase